MKELEECLEGQIFYFYKTITSIGEPKFETVKERIIDQVRRVKAGIKYKRSRDFEKARMGKNESVDMYAHRLETLARKKFGNEGINENKELMKKFIDTIPRYIAEFINLKRKEKMRWTSERLVWEDVLELVEDRVFERNNQEVDEDGWIEVGMAKKQYKSYKDALKSSPVGVTTNFLNSYFGQQGMNGRKGTYVNGGGQSQYRMNVVSENRRNESGIRQGSSLKRNMINPRNGPKC